MLPPSDAMPTVEYLSIDANTGSLGIGNIPPVGEAYFEVPIGTDPNEVYVHEGAVCYYPPRPGLEHYWSFDIAKNCWIDTRDPDAEHQGRRAMASMTRSDFLLAAIRAGIIQPSDAGPAARGEIPPSLAPVFSSMPPEVQLEAVVRWGAATMIDRTNPVLAALAAAMAVTDEQLDALFGI